MKILPKLCIFFLLLPASLFAQPGVRMSADFLPLEVGNRWVYDLLSENGQKVGSLDFAVQEYRIVGGRSFYLLTSFPFVTEDTTPTKLIRYNRQERQYMKMGNNEETPLFLADGAKAEVIQADESGLPQKFILKMDLMDLTFQRGLGIVEARLHAGSGVQIAKITNVHVGERQAAQAAAQGAPSLPQPGNQPLPSKGVKRLRIMLRRCRKKIRLLMFRSRKFQAVRDSSSRSSILRTSFCRSISGRAR